jgi:hypothetical protein
MSSDNHVNPVQKLLALHWRDQGLLISKGLLAHEKFLLKFNPTGDAERDTAAFLIGVGQRRMLATYQEFGLPLQGLAIEIRRNHRLEIKNLKQGKRPSWTGQYQRWNPEQRVFYQHLLELEEQTLSAILKTGRTQAA